MLYLHFGGMENEISRPDMYFEGVFDKQNLLTDFSRRVIKEIDNSEVFDRNVVISPILGGISPTRLSTGVKGILLYKYYDMVINLTHFGDNCLSLLQEISLEKDITMAVSRFPNFFISGREDVPVTVINDNRNIVITNHREMCDIVADYYDMW